MAGVSGQVGMYRTRHRVEILELLLGATDRISCADITRATGMNLQVAHRNMLKLARSKWVSVRRMPGRNGHFAYALTWHGREEAYYLVNGYTIDDASCETTEG